MKQDSKDWFILLDCRLIFFIFVFSFCAKLHLIYAEVKYFPFHKKIVKLPYKVLYGLKQFTEDRFCANRHFSVNFITNHGVTFNSCTVQISLIVKYWPALSTNDIMGLISELILSPGCLQWLCIKTKHIKCRFTWTSCQTAIWLIETD